MKSVATQVSSMSGALNEAGRPILSAELCMIGLDRCAVEKAAEESLFSRPLEAFINDPNLRFQVIEKFVSCLSFINRSILGLDTTLSKGPVLAA